MHVVKNYSMKTRRIKPTELNLYRSTAFYMYSQYFDFFITSTVLYLYCQWIDVYFFQYINSFQYSQCFDFWQLSTDNLHYLTRVHYLAENAPDRGTWGEHEIDYILVAQKDVDVTPNPNEVESYTYVSQEQLRHMIGMLFTLFIYQSPL